MTGETIEEKIERVLKERIELVDYNPGWPLLYQEESAHLLSCLPLDLVLRIEHFGSTAIPGMRAKPIIDMLVEVTSAEDTRLRIAPLLEAQGYDYFWRPTLGDDTPPFYPWFIKRDPEGRRTHHIHMVEGAFPQWDGLLFRDYLIAEPEAAKRYARLKQQLAEDYRDDRVAYTVNKSAFVREITGLAKKCFGSPVSGAARDG